MEWYLIVNIYGFVKEIKKGLRMARMENFISRIGDALYHELGQENSRVGVHEFGKGLA